MEEGAPSVLLWLRGGSLSFVSVNIIFTLCVLISVSKWSLNEKSNPYALVIF